MVYQLKRLQTNERPQAFWGSLIPSAISFIGGLITSSQQAKAQRRALEEQQRLAQQQLNISNQNQLASSLNNYTSAQQSYDNKDYNLKYRIGGVKRLGSRNIMITDGGNAKRIGNNTYLLRGGSHEDINETGQTGIGINVGGNEIEAEGGEVAQRKGNSLRIYSAQPILGGISPAQAIMRGYNKDKVFNAQQRFKKNNGIKDDGSKAAFGNLITMPFAGIVKDVVNYFSNSGKYATKRVKVSNKTVNRKPIRNSQVGNFRVVNGKYFPNEKPLRQVYPEFDIISMGRGLPIKRSLKNTVGFVQKPNTFTRGIGNREGIKDLVESKVVRGNPVGTEMSAKAYTKATKFNRNSFNDIMNGTGREGISHRYYNRSLSKEDFNAIQESYNKINASFKARHPKASNKIRFAIGDDVYDPLVNYKNYDDYLAQIASDRKTLRNATTINPDNGEPIAYFYNDGRNPLTQGHGYASSKWGVRISNPQDYNMKIFDGHLHYSNSKTIPFDSPNVEVFRSTPFGTIRYPKWMLRRGWYRNGGLTSKDRGSSKHPYPSVSYKDFAGGNRSYPIPTKADAIDALRLAGLHGRSDVRSKVYSKYPSLRKKAENGTSISLGSSYTNNQDLLHRITQGHPTARKIINEIFGDEADRRRIIQELNMFGFGSDDASSIAGASPIFRQAIVSAARQAQFIQNANKVRQAAKASQAAQRTAYAAKEAKDFYRGLGINIPVGRNQIYNPTFRSSLLARNIEDSNKALQMSLNNTHLPKGIRLTPVDQSIIDRTAARVINPREAELVKQGINISQSARNMTSGANPFLYVERTPSQIRVGLNRAFGVTKQGFKSAGQKVKDFGNKVGSSSTYRTSISAERVRDANGRLIWKQNYKYKPWVKATAGATGTAGIIGLGVGLSNTKSENKSIKAQLDAKGKPISPYIARPQEPGKPLTRQVPATIARKDTTRKDTTKQVNKVVKRQVRTTPQYKGNTTKGNYQLHDGETKIINGVTYTRRGNTIINHKTNVGYIYDKNGNYTGQADYSKVGNFNQAFDAARAAGRSQFIYRAGKYNNYSTIKETNAKKEALNRRIGARRIAKRMGGLVLRPKARNGAEIEPYYDWARNTSSNLRISFIDPTYDYRTYYNSVTPYERNLIRFAPQGTHFTDIGKTPKHPTFSNESIYSNKKYPGGTWNGNVFVPNIWQFGNNGNSRRNKYMNNSGEGYFNGRVNIFPKYRKRIAKRMGCLTNPPVERFKCGGRIRPKAEDGMLAPVYSYGTNRRKLPSFATIDITPRAIPNFKPVSVPTNIKTPFDPNSVPYLGKQSSFKPTTQDYIGLGIDTLAALGSGIFTRSAYNKMNFDYALPNYVDESTVAFDTTYHNEAQRANVERNRLNARGLITGNTSSAQTALNLMQKTDTDAMMETNKLLDEKSNKEVELRNQNAANEQQVRARNAAARNQYYQNVAQIKNAAIEAKNNMELAKAQSIGADLSGLSQAWNNFASSVENRYDARQNTIAAMSSANSPSVVKNAISLGYDLSPEVLANLYKNSKNEELRNAILGRLSPNERKRYGIE